MEFLKREGLYSPQMKEMRTDDPVATDLIGALLTVSSFYSCTLLFSHVIKNIDDFDLPSIYSKVRQTQCHHDVAQMILLFDRQIVRIQCYYH